MMMDARGRFRAANEAVMRRLLALLGLIAWTSTALAGEFELPTLRGTQSFVPVAPEAPRWRGVYVGGQIAFGNDGADFSKATESLVAHMLRELALESEQSVSKWELLGKSQSRSGGYGGFIGYNVGWESVVIGFELNWSKTNFSNDAPVSPLTRVTSAGGNTYAVTLTGSGSAALTSFATVRTRAAWEVGNFLPYAMVGGAVGWVNFSRSATVSGTQTDSTGAVVPFSFSESESKNGAWIYGVAVGAGVDVMVLPKVFLRAEYEYVAFAPLAGINLSVNTVRAGLGFKF
jgi:outer membrane immunogenic protein